MKNNSPPSYWIVLFLLTIFFATFIFCMLAYATDCPPGAKSCKVITITPDEEQTLVAPNGIFDMSEWASRPLAPMIYQWRRKIEMAPAGDVKKPDAKP